MQQESTVTEKKQEYTSNKEKLGCFPTPNHAEFRVFSSVAERVEVEIFESYDQKSGTRYDLNKNGNDIWQLTIKGNFLGKLYGYRIYPKTDDPDLKHHDEVVADPYSKMVITRNHYLQYPKTLIIGEDDFDWEDDTFVTPEDPRDLIIYETHIKDLTAHASSGCKNPGTYNGFVEKNITGGLEYLKKLGVNAIEFLPLQKFAYFEPPHNEPIEGGLVNTWNYYSKNYWGYMTSFFFAPETLYAGNGSTKADAVLGREARAIREFKTMVKEIHKAGMSVIMDVVYNHVSQYDLNPFKQLDRNHYFRLTEENEYTSDSGCGNDFKTESEYARKVIVDSILYWMKEFHVDGFRFDLANLIDSETMQLIKEEAEKINPNVILIAEPWGGGYNPTGFSEIEWPSWNDQVRNGVKGSDPENDLGYIFGKWQWETNRQGLENFLAGSLLGFSNGRYHTSMHSVNYLESHDGYTLGDFIRIGLDASKAGRKFKSRDELVKLEDNERKLCKLAALYLFVSQGILMIHEGQEFGRTKFIEPVDGVKDPYVREIDHNSYEKDSETNYINFDDIKKNRPLFNYYKGLIELRKAAPALRKSPPHALDFWNYSDSLHITCTIHGEASGDPYDYIISLNGNPYGTHRINLPAGLWEVVANDKIVKPDGFDVTSSELSVHPSSGYILRKLRDI